MGELVTLERVERARQLREANNPAEARYDTKGLCAVLHVSPSTIKRWRNRGMPYEVWGTRSYRYRLSAVIRWREDQFGS
jgi:phage terminase Nu1 subunit (DNA packaging protein)